MIITILTNGHNPMRDLPKLRSITTLKTGLQGMPLHQLNNIFKFNKKLLIRG